MGSRYDAIVLGAGHNGLVCGAYLARAGLKVLVLERRHVIGGACTTEELWPGYRISTAAYSINQFQTRIVDDLELGKFGFEVLPRHHVFTPFPDGRYLVFWDDPARTCAEIARFSKKDAEAYPVFRAFLREAGDLVRQILWVTPPDLASRRVRDVVTLGTLAWKARKLGGRAYRFIQMMTGTAREFLDRYFESDAVKAALMVGAVAGNNAAPSTPGSAYMLLHHSIGGVGSGFVRGGMGGVSEAIARSGRRYGMTIRTGAEVAEVSVKEGRVTGVVLRSGEAIPARLVVSNADPKRTFLRLVDPRHLPPEFLGEVRAFKTYGTSYKVNLAVEEPPRYTAFDPRVVGTDHPTYVRIGPSVDYFERGYDEARQGRPSSRPYVIALLPTIVDPDLAPKGKHTLLLSGRYAPYTLAEGSWDEERERFGDTVLDTLAEYAPNVKASVIHRQVLVPPDLELIFGLTEGNVSHGELSLDQLFFLRPVAGYADYRSPLAGLYQCGAGTHPGGGVMGVSGHNAAREILRDLRRWKVA